jgi:hypothetical protein
MQRREALGGIGQQGQRLVHRHAAVSLEPVAERAVRAELHHDEGVGARTRDHVVDRDDMRAGHRGKGTGFPVEAPREHRVAGEARPENLQRDVPVELLVVGAPDRSHATRAQARVDPVSTSQKIADARHWSRVPLDRAAGWRSCVPPRGRAAWRRGRPTCASSRAGVSSPA